MKSYHSINEIIKLIFFEIMPLNSKVKRFFDIQISIAIGIKVIININFQHHTPQI